MFQNRSKRDSLKNLALALIPNQKRDRYSEIWDGDLEEIVGLRRFAYHFEALRIAVNLRWASWGEFLRTFLILVFGFAVLGLGTLVHYRLGDLLFAVLLFFSAWLVDMRRNRFRRAIEALATLYLLIWLLFSIESTVAHNANLEQPALIFLTLVTASTVLVQILFLFAVRDFDDYRQVRMVGAMLLFVSLPVSIVARLFIDLADYLPPKLIQNFHQLFSDLGNWSRLCLGALVICAAIFHVYHSQIRSYSFAN